MMILTKRMSSEQNIKELENVVLMKKNQDRNLEENTVHELYKVNGCGLGILVWGFGGKLPVEKKRKERVEVLLSQLTVSNLERY